jgi:hypothetical protein
MSGKVLLSVPLWILSLLGKHGKAQQKELCQQLCHGKNQTTVSASSVCG